MPSSLAREKIPLNLEPAHSTPPTASPEHAIEGAEPTRRQLLTWLGNMATATAIVGIVPLSGCGESPDETLRRVGEENPHLNQGTAEMLEIRRERRKRDDADKDDEAAESSDSHGSLRCWKDLLHPKKWFGTHWDNLLMSTAAGLGPQMFPGDSDFENGLARVLAGTMTFFNGLTRGIVAPETVYAFFLTLWGKWSDIFGTLTEWRRGSGE